MTVLLLFENVPWEDGPLVQVVNYLPEIGNVIGLGGNGYWIAYKITKEAWVNGTGEIVPHVWYHKREET